MKTDDVRAAGPYTIHLYCRLSNTEETAWLEATTGKRGKLLGEAPTWEEVLAIWMAHHVPGTAVVLGDGGVVVPMPDTDLAAGPALLDEEYSAAELAEFRAWRAARDADEALFPLDQPEERGPMDVSTDRWMESGVVFTELRGA